MRTIAIDIDKDKLRDFCRKWKITEFALLGSVTRPEEFRDDSDVDVLVRFAPDAPWSLSRWLQMRELIGSSAAKSTSWNATLWRKTRTASDAGPSSNRRCCSMSRDLAS